jgi:TolB-like protein
MTFIQLNDKDFIGRLTEFILADLKDENFGVREFAAIQVTIPADNSQQVSGSKEKVKRNRILKLILISAMILAVAGTVAFTAYRIMDQNSAAGFQASHDDRLSVAVLPFRNMTNDSAWNIWQEGIQSCLINSLGNVNDIIVRSEETINDIIESAGVTNYASLELDLAIDVTQRLSSKVFLYGNINKAGPTIRLNAQLIEAENEEVFSSIHIDGSSERILEMIDSLSIAINNALIMFELEKIKPENIHDYKDNTTKSPDTYKYFIYGNLAYYKNDFPTAIELYLQALEKDSTFYKPMAKLATAYYNLYNFKQGKE